MSRNKDAKRNLSLALYCAMALSIFTQACGGGDSGCTDDCDPTEGLRCHETLVQVCAKQDEGCFAWTTQKDCGADDRICNDHGGNPVCVSREN